MLGEVQNLEEDCFDFSEVITVFVNKDLYAFAVNNPVHTFKITNFATDDRLNTTLSTLPRYYKELFFFGFAVCYWEASDSIVLTGGSDVKENGDKVDSAETNKMDVQSGCWEQKLHPALKVARWNHSMMALGQQCYVACGTFGPLGPLSSIEMIRLGVRKWELIKIPDLTPR